MMNEIDNPEKLYKYMKENILYGFISKNGTKYLRNEVDENKYMYQILHNYYFQSPEDVFINKCGVCFDQVNFAKNILLNNGYEVKTYYTKIHNHVFLVCKYNDKYCYMERTIPYKCGLYLFDSLKELFQYYLFIQDDDKLKEVEFYEYNNVIYGCDFYDFISNIKKQNNIKMVLKRN